MTDSFDPQAFLDSTTEEAMDTKLIPCPVGEWNAQITSVEVSPWVSQTKGTSGLKAEVRWEILDDEPKQVTNLDKVTVKQDIMLDTIDVGGNPKLDVRKGKNIGLGRLREAVGLNKPGQPFSFLMLSGQMAKVSVGHREWKGDLFAEVKGVTAA